MRVLYQNRKTLEIKLKVQNLNDLWHLYNLVAPGDLIRAFTYRRAEDKSDKLRPERLEKKPMTLGIRVDHLEFTEFSDRVRIQGRIEEGPQDISAHHSLQIGLEDDLTIIKDWKDRDLERIREAVEKTDQPKVTFLSMDEEEALLAQLVDYGVQEVARIQSHRPGKDHPQEETESTYHGEVLAKLKLIELGEKLLVLGPGFAKDNFLKFLRERGEPLPVSIENQNTAHPGMNGIQETMRSGFALKALEGSRVARETKLLEELLERIARSTPCAYGVAEVQRALELGAVELLLMGEDMARTSGGEALLGQTERQRGRVEIFSKHHEAGRKLKGLGEVAAFLRFPIA